MTRRPVHLDLDELNRIAGVVFDDNDIADLVELTSDYAERFHGHIPDYMLLDSPITKDLKKAELEARRAYVAAVESVWRERKCAGGVGSYYDPMKEAPAGPLFKLVFYLLGGANVRVGCDTIHHDIVYVSTGRERKRS